MKITNKMRFMLVMLSVVMVLSLFACAETPEETTTKAPEATTEKPTETTEKTEPTEAPVDTDATDAPVVDETTDVEAAETTEAATESESASETASESATTETTEAATTETETTEAPACDHAETEVDAGKAATCTEDGLTEGSHCVLCGAVVVAQDVIPAAHTLTDVEATAPTCTEDGVVAHANCSVCGKNFDAEGNELATIVDPAKGHNVETVAAADPTCSAEGNEEYKKCSNCGAMWDMEDVALEVAPSIEISPSAHKMNDVAYMAPTTAEAGVAAHSVCEYCGVIWSDEGVVLGAAPTIDKLAPTTEAYFGVEELKNVMIKGAGESLFNAPEASADRTYVRFSRAGASSDGNVQLFEGNTEVTGKYFIIKYRTDHVTKFQLWANTTDNGHSGGRANYEQAAIADGEWHMLVIDLSVNLSNYVKADENGAYTIQWGRIDLLDGEFSEGYFDVAYIVYCDDPTEVTSVLQAGDKQICTHIQAEDAKYTDDGDTHYTNCMICEAKISGAHSASNGATWNDEQGLYVGTCVCGKAITSEMIYKTNASPNGGGAIKSFTAEQHEGFVRYTATGSADPYFHVLRGNTVVTGQYVVIKYRIVNNGSNCTAGGFYSGSVIPGYNGAQGGAAGDGETIKQVSTLYADGEWHYLVVTPNLAKNNAFKPNEDGTYTWQYLRMGIGGMKAFDGSCYIDIAELAFADNIKAAEKYAYKNESNAAFSVNLDFVKLDDVDTGVKGGASNASMAVDLSGKTITNAATSLELGGWCVTPGGITSYNIRVTSIDGAAVENPQLVKWMDGTTIPVSDGVVTQGTNRGFGTDCSIGARYYETAVDLSAWAGHTINFELVIVTSYGCEATIIQINNVAVPAAQ